MHCPKCGQLQVSEETRFCSRCGLLLTGIAEVVARDGIVEPRKTSIAGNVDSPKRRGIKQGAFLFLLTFVIVPILALISMALDIEPFLPVIGVFLVWGGGGGVVWGVGGGGGGWWWWWGGCSGWCWWWCSVWCCGSRSEWPTSGCSARR